MGTFNNCRIDHLPLSVSAVCILTMMRVLSVQNFSVTLLILGKLNRSLLGKNSHLLAGVSAGDKFFSHCTVSGHFLFNASELLLITAARKSHCSVISFPILDILLN